MSTGNVHECIIIYLYRMRMKKRGRCIDCGVKSLGKLYSPRDKVTEKIRIELNSSRNRRRLYYKGRGISPQLYRHHASLPPSLVPPPQNQRTFMYSDRPHFIILLLGCRFKRKLYFYMSVPKHYFLSPKLIS